MLNGIKNKKAHKTAVPGLHFFGAAANTAAAPRAKKLFSQTEFFDDCTVTLNIFLLKIRKKLTAVTYHFKQAATAVVVLVVFLQMFGKVLYSRSKQSYLYFGRTCIGFVNPVGFDYRKFFFFHRP